MNVRSHCTSRCRLANVIVLGGMLMVVHMTAVANTLKTASKLYKQGHYEEAVRYINKIISTLPAAQQSSASLLLGIIYHKNAELYREFGRAAQTAQYDYLKKMSRTRGRSRSRFVHLYLGQNLLHRRQAAAAAKHLKRFIAQKGVGARHKSIGRIALGLAYYRQNNRKKARQIWQNTAKSHPDTKAALAAVYSEVRLKGTKPVAMADSVVRAMRKSRHRPSARTVASLLHVYARSGQPDKGLKLAREAELHAASYTEARSKRKTINFYDVTLPRDLAKLYSLKSIAALEQVARDGAKKAQAEFYLVDSYIGAGHYRKAEKMASALLAQGGLPPQLQEQVRIHQATAVYLRNRKSEAVGLWARVARKKPINADLVAEAVAGCTRARGKCTSLVSAAKSVAQSLSTRRARKINTAIGRYYFTRKKYKKALFHLEAARDKSRKNRIETNDPLLLTTLAGAYYMQKSFSENLEIYFEMSKEFPIVRQIQESMQGIYSMEQKSAGDVKIF